jgi:hypothetical protein
MSNECFCEIGWRALQVSCQTRPHAEFSAIRQRSTVRRNRRCADRGRMVTKKASVRSVRTRRYARSSRGGTAKNIVQGFRSCLDRKKRPECRVDSVNHSASPLSPRKRATSNQVLSKPVCRHRTSACSALRRRIPQSVVFNTFSSFAFPIAASLASISFPCPKRA